MISAGKTGFAAEAQEKINLKYNDELAAECLEWIMEVTGEPINMSGDMENFYEMLKDGVILCKLINALEPGRIKKVNESKMAFKCMENISAFLECAKAFGVAAQELFQTVDLWERQNLNSVVICLQSLGRKVSASYLFLIKKIVFTFFNRGKNLPSGAPLFPRKFWNQWKA